MTSHLFYTIGRSAIHVNMTHISKRELKMLEQDRRENCGDEGYRYTKKRHGDEVVSDKQIRKARRENINKKSKNDTLQSQIMPDSIEARISQRQKPTATVRLATRAAPAASKPGFNTQLGKSTSIKASVTGTAPTRRAKPSGDIKVVSVGEIVVKTKSDAIHCWITGSALLPDNKLILADCHNHTVKLVDLQTSTVTLEMKTATFPWDLTSINKELVAVTVPSIKKILVVKVTDQLRLDRELPVDGRCRAVLHSHGNLIVSFDYPCKIEIMSLDGNVKRRIADSESFQWTHYMAHSTDSEIIYVSDFTGKCVKRLSLGGTVQATYKDPELRGPTGLVGLGQQDRLLVCGYRSHNIFMLEPGHTKMKLILMIRNPYSLSYCTSTDRLYVGFWGCNNINVYEVMNCFEK